MANGTPGRLTLSLTVTAEAAIPRAVARFTPPTGAFPGAGEALEHEHGAMARGDQRTVTVAVGGALATFIVGVDCHPSEGVSLYGVTSIGLPPPRRTSIVSRIREGLRARPARRR